jgi:hypothetical protein
MWRWRSSKKHDFPSYSLLEAVPSRCLPPDLVDRGNADPYQASRNRIESGLFAQTTDENSPGFATFLKADEGLLQMLLPELSGGCLLAFSSPMRAADYARVQVPDKKFNYFCSSAAQVVSGIGQLREQAGIRHMALDRCPRCKVFTSVAASSLDTAAKVITVWKIAKATEIARCNLYLDYARAAAAAGQFLAARNVALEIIGHVTSEDPRPHLLLGKLAIQLGERQLLREAQSFLALLKQDAALIEIEAARKSKRVHY